MGVQVYCPGYEELSCKALFSEICPLDPSRFVKLIKYTVTFVLLVSGSLCQCQNPLVSQQ